MIYLRRLSQRVAHLFLLTFQYLVLSTVTVPWIECEGQVLLKYQVEDIVSQKGELYFPDSLTRNSYLEAFLHSLHLEGYPAAHIRSKTFVGDTLDVRLEAGQLFSWMHLRQGNLDGRRAMKAGYQESTFRRQPVNFVQLRSFFDGILDEAQNTGYPFATVRLDSLAMEEEGLVAAINFDPGPFITFDTLDIDGDSKTKSLFLSRLLQVAPGAPFSQAAVDHALKSLQKIPYLQLVDQPSLTFRNETAQVTLPINDRRINTLDGIIGVLPNEAEDNKLLVTGQFNLSLYNVGGKGREYSLQWQRLSRYSQNLSLRAKEPVLFGSLLDLSVSFDLLKEDTTFLNRDFKVGLTYPVRPELTVGFFSRRQAGDMLKVPEEELTARITDIADFRFSNYGIDLVWNTFDQLFAPRRGGLAAFEAGIGNKKILDNTAMPSSAYEGFDKNAIQYYATFSAERHLYLSPSFGAWLRLRGGEMANKNLFLNDLFRLGGLSSFRGFNENFFFAKQYVYVNFEPRYYFHDYSYFLLFLDMGRVWNKVGTAAKDWPRSSGMGVRLDTDGGVFNFIIAWGRSHEQAVGLKTPHIHFGYTGKF